MVERCRNMDAVEYSMFLHRPIPISWSILRQSPNFLVSVHVYRTILVDLLTKINENKSCFHTHTLTAYDARPAALTTPGSRLLSL